MGNAIVALFGSRKFFVGLLTMATVICVVILRALDKLPADALVPTMASVSAIGLGIIASIAWEDAAAKGAGIVNTTNIAAPAPAASEPAAERSTPPPAPPSDG